MQKPTALGLVTSDEEIVVRRRADPARRQKLVRLLSILLDSPDTPDNRP
jgi:hypothetical protein